MGDKIAGLENRFPVGCSSRQKVELRNRHRPASPGALDVYDRFESSQRYILIRGIGGNTVFARSENSQHSVVATNSITAGAGLALVAGCIGVPIVDTARLLEQVPSGCRHVP